MALNQNITRLFDQLVFAKADAAGIADATYAGGVAAMEQADPKKRGKEKKPDVNLVSLVFP